MRSEGPPQRPGTAFGLSLSGAIIIVIGSLFFLILGISFLTPFVAIALVAGTIALAASILLYLRVGEHVWWGVVVLVASAVSIVGFGGFVIGMILGIIGGALAIAWRPETWQAFPPVGPYGVPVMPWRMCFGCGRWIPWAYNVCPLCGHQAPVAAWAPRPAAPPKEPGAAAPPPPTAPAPAPVPAARAPCPTCDGEAEWNTVYQRWYCAKESRYF